MELRQSGSADFFIELSRGADLSSAEDIQDWERRGEWVVDELRRTARDSQREIRATLDGAGVDYTPYWIVNTVLVHDAPAQLAGELARHEAVEYLWANTQVPVPELVEVDVTTTQQAVEWGIANIRADEVWSDLGVRGEGLVVGSIDTGAEWQHPALRDSYRGVQPDGSVVHDYHWFDPAGVCGTPSEPCDNQGHGTHTLGTAVGGADAEGTSIGVAPGASWIAAKGCEATTQADCSLAALLEAGQWMLAPTDTTGANPRPELRPHLINNSWGGNTGAVTDPFYDEVLQAWNAAGIFAAFSNGNDGARGCSTSGSPADSPHAYAVGAHDEEDVIAPFSSRGPEGDGRSRPHITAPGVMVRSAVPGGRYAYANGTSMAAPHVTGAVALLWAAAPDLVGDIHGTRELLGQTAIDTEDLSCGGTPEQNNVYGEGRLDVRAAAEAAPTGPAGTLSGLVTDATTGEGLAGVTVRAVPHDGSLITRTTTTRPDGQYSVHLPVGSYAVEFTRYGYVSAAPSAVVVGEDQTPRVDRALEKKPTAVVTGNVTDGSGQGWGLYAGISITGYPYGTLWTDPGTGAFEVELPTDSTYEFVVHTPYEGYLASVSEVTVRGDTTVADISLPVDAAERCPAMGYEPGYSGLFEDFDGDEPSGWSVETTRGDGWVFDDPGERGNRTGGTGAHAVVDSNAGVRFEASMLTSPVVDLGDAAAPEVSFRSDLSSGSRATAAVELSTDGGATWEAVWSRTQRAPGPELVRVPLAGAAGQDAVRVRFVFDGNDRSQQGWWQVDEVLVGSTTCSPLEGGLLVGQVRDDRTGAPLSGATVRTGDESTRTGQTPQDTDLGGGFYWLFSPVTGLVEVTAANALGQHHPQTLRVDVPSGQTVRADLALGSGELVLEEPTGVLTATLGDDVITDVRVTNVGTAPATFSLVERDGTLEVPDPRDSEWVRLNDIPIARSNGLAGVHDGTLVLIGGSADGAVPISQRSYRYDIETDEWQLTQDFHEYRSNPVGGFVDGLMYVIGGSAGTRGIRDTVLTYDPGSDTWGERGPAPYAVMTAGHAVLDDRIYLFGGYGADGELIDTGAVYDPAEDSWQVTAPYPERAAAQMCGTIDGVIYCAGGVTTDADGFIHLSRAYAYRPEIDEWFRIPDLPMSVVAAGYTAANGLLLISGGQVGGSRSNQGFFYDPGVNAWQEMPPSLFDLFGVGSGCGFYKVSGTQGRPGFFPYVEQLPGFDDCDTSGGDRLPWLEGTEGSVTVPPGETVEVTLRAQTAALDQPGRYEATLMVLEDTPRRSDPLSLTVQVDPPDRWGVVTGTVSATTCGSTEPLAGADVHFDALDVDVRVQTDDAGRYTYHLPVPRGRLTLTASAEGMTEESRMVRPLPKRTVTEDFTLHRAGECDG